MSKKIIKICKDASKIVEADITEMINIINEQANFVHPLKHKKQETLKKLSDKNRRILSAFLILRRVVLEETNPEALNYPENKINKVS